MSASLFGNRSSFKILALLAVLILLMPSMSGASAQKPARPAPPAPPAQPAAPDPPEASEAPAEELLPPQGWLGVVLSDEGTEGVTVTGVKEGSPAEKAGLKQGDRILEMDGRKVERPRDIRGAMRELEPGDTVQIRIRRDSQEKTLTATVGKSPDRLFRGYAPFWHQEGAPGALDLALLEARKNYLGVRLQSMTEDLRAYFKAPRGRGLLVSRVEEDTPAAKAGLRAGDVIVAVDGKGISDRSDIAQALSDHQAGDRVPVKIVRDGAEKTLEVEIAERPGPRRHGSIWLPADEEDFDLDREDDSEWEFDLPRIHGISEETGAMLRESLERAGEEIRRAMREFPETRAQVAAALSKVRFSEDQREQIRRQIQEAMEQARETLRHMTGAMTGETI